MYWGLIGEHFTWEEFDNVIIRRVRSKERPTWAFSTFMIYYALFRSLGCTPHWAYVHVPMDHDIETGEPL